jgi:ABC-type dipeptide/oligopeptide/nickel transport system permease subunit
MSRGRHTRRTGIALSVTGAVLVGIVVAMGVVSLFWTPYDPYAMSHAERFAAPSSAHLLGCDQFGRDVLSRIMVAAQPALVVGVGSVVLGGFVGVALGALAATLRPLRAITMRLMDAIMAFPGILLAMVLVLVMERGLASTFVAVAVFMVPTFARLSYSLVLEAWGRPYVKAARSYGSSGARIVVRQVLPNIMPRIVTQLSASVGAAILLEASLSFLGLGIQPPQPSWGVMVSEAVTYVFSYPALIVAPGAMLLLCVLGFNLLGDGLNDLLVERGA